MIASRLLSKVPKNINLAADFNIQRSGGRHTLIVNLIGTVFVSWLVSSFAGGFPITFSGPAVDVRVMPDYASGKTYTEFRLRERYYDSI
jgi:hypothetical protein